LNFIVRTLDRIWPKESLPFGLRWRIFGSYLSVATNVTKSLLKRGLPWFKDRGIYIHRMDRPDGDRDCHNHPYAYMSIVLWGGYLEMVKQGDAIRPVWRRPGSIIFASAERYHRVDYLPNKRCWTLFFTGKPRWMQHNGKFVHDWGFLTISGHVPWTKYRRGGRA
jgi:hypothetical protein